jgi:hypothetical protein
VAEKRRAFTIHELYDLPAAVDLMTAARALHMGRTTAYKLARSGEFPCRLLRYGGTYRVPPRSSWSSWACLSLPGECRLESSRHSDSICCRLGVRPVPFSAGGVRVLTGDAVGFHDQMTVKTGRALLSEWRSKALTM